MTSVRITRRRLLIGASASMATVVLAACGEAPSPDVGDLPRLPTAAAETARAVVQNKDAAPKGTVPVKLAVPVGNFLADRLAVRLTSLATDATTMASAPAPLTIVTLQDSAHPRPEDTMQALDSVLPTHPDIDLIVLPEAALAFGLADAGRVQALDDYTRDAATFSTDDFTPVSLDALRDAGSLYGLPLWTSTNVLRYSERALERAGVQPGGTDGWSWSEFAEASQRLTTLDAPGAPSQWGVWLAPGSYPSQQWIWQKDGTVVDLNTRKATVTSAEAVAAIEFMSQLQREGTSPRFDLNAERAPRLEIRAGLTLVDGVPVAMLPARIGGGFGASGIGHFAGGFGEGASARRVGTFQGRGGDHGPAAGAPTESQGEPGRLAVMPLPREAAAAAEAGVIGLVGLMATSQRPRAAFQMMAWLVDQVGDQAAIPARRPTPETLVAISSEFSDSDARAIVASAYAGRIIPGRQSSAIARVLMEEIDLPVLTANADPVIAAANAAARIDSLLDGM